MVRCLNHGVQRSNRPAGHDPPGIITSDYAPEMYMAPVRVSRLLWAGLCVLFTLSLIGGCTQTDGTDTLIKDLKSGDPATQRSAAEELSGMGTPAVRPLIEVFSSGDPAASQWAAAALCEIGGPSVDPLIATFSTDGVAARDWAVVTLACIGEPAAGPLIEALWSDDGRVSDAASVALIKIGPAAIPALQELQSSPFAEKREKAVILIQSIALSEELKKQALQEDAPLSSS
jgi:HEAT repeat protein